MVERNIDVVEVRGSNPLSRTIISISEERNAPSEYSAPLLDFRVSIYSFLLLLNLLLPFYFQLLMIFVSGSIAYDTIISTVGTFDSSRRGDDKHYSYSLYAPRVIRQAGGTGHNIAYSLGLL